MLDRRGTLWRLDPVTLRTRATVRVPVGEPYWTDMAVGAGATWVVGPGGASAVDTRTMRVRHLDMRGLPQGMAPIAVAAGRRAVWVVARSDGDRSAVCRLDPRTGAVRACPWRTG